jgi:hypothetical protein
MAGRVDDLLAASPAPGPDEVTAAFWQACHGGQRRMAEHLLSRGADINGIPGYAQHTAVDVAAEPDARRALLRDWLRDRGCRPAAGER